MHRCGSGAASHGKAETFGKSATARVLDPPTGVRSTLTKLTSYTFVWGHSAPATLTFVKPWRIWLLMLLAVLLPVRGAVAAAMLCPATGSGAQVELATAGQTVVHEAMDHVLSHDQLHGQSDELRHTGGHDHAAGASHDGHQSPDHAVSEGCNACSAYCSLTPLVSNLPTLAAPLDPATVKFSDLSAPAPTFQSDGQERPPRTI